MSNSTLDSEALALRALTRGRWLALAAAILGWMFDGVEIGLFPPIARPAMTELITAVTPQTSDVSDEDHEKQIKSKADTWIGIMTAAFLIGAATGGVVFGDRKSTRLNSSHRH